MTSHSLYLVLLARKLSPSDLCVHWTESAYSYPSSLETRIDTFWTRHASPHLFNGNLARLDSFLTAHNGSVTLYCRPVEYKRILYTEHFPQDIITAVGRTGLARALGVSVVLKTSDNRMVFIHRSHSVGEYPNHYDVVGGHIEAPVYQPQDIFAAIKTEIREELNLSIWDSQLELLGLAEVCRTGKPELIFFASVAVTESDIRQLATSAVDADEYQGLFFLPEMQINSVSRENGLWAPSALAALDIYQRTRPEV